MASEICKNCFWWKHEDGKKICLKSAPTFTCKDWGDKDITRACANCAFYRKDDCPYEDAEIDDVCMKWKAMSSEVPVETQNLPTKNDVKEMLIQGKDPLEITKMLGFETTDFDAKLSVYDNQVNIIRHHLNTVFNILPAAELKARMEPTSYNVAAVTSLIDASRELLDDLNDRSDPRELYNKLVAQVLEPLTTSFLEILTINLADTRNKMKEYVYDNRQSMLETTINLCMKQMGASMNEALRKQLRELETLMGVEPGD